MKIINASLAMGWFLSSVPGTASGLLVRSRLRSIDVTVTRENERDDKAILENTMTEQSSFWQRFLEDDSLSTPPPTTTATTVSDTLEPSSSPFLFPDLLATQDDLSTMYSLVGPSGIDNWLDDPSWMWTFFAPTDEAFFNFDQELLTRFLQPEWVLHLRYLLGAHLVLHTTESDLLFARNLTLGLVVESFVNPSSFNVSSLDGGVFLSGATFDNIPVVESDLRVDNGVLHKVGGVMMPPFLIEDIIDFLTNNQLDGFMTMFRFILQVGLEQYIRDNLLTILWPLDGAFASLPEEIWDELTNPNNEENLRNVLLYHMIPGFYPTDFLGDGLQFATAQGSVVTFTAYRDENQNAIVLFDDAPVNQFDLLSGQTILHTLNGVLTPPLLERR